MAQPALQPPQVMPSVYGPPPRQYRAAHLPGMVSLGIRDLFPDVAAGYLQGQGLPETAAATRRALDGTDLSMIKPGHSVNILCSEHGFYLLEGLHYREMLSTLGQVVRERTGCRDIRYRLATGVTIKEGREVIDYFDLKNKLPGRVTAISPWDKAVPIETVAGTLYGLAHAYDADWIIHATHDEPRDLYFYRMMDRLLKAFVMSYARYETRAVYHGAFFSRSANFLQRAIFDSPFVQKRFALACVLRSSPAGITGVDAGNDLLRLDRRVTVALLRDFGKMLRLLASIDECIAVMDAGRLMYYLHAGGICFGCLENAEYDAFDLSNPAAMGAHDMVFKLVRGEIDNIQHIMTVHPSIKAVVINQAWPGLPITDVPMAVPTIVAGSDMAEILRRDPANPNFMRYAVTAETLDAAVDFARRVTKTDNVLAFDGSFGSVTVSPSLAAFLVEKAPAVNRRVEQELLPIWLKQRGIAPEDI